MDFGSENYFSKVLRFVFLIGFHAIYLKTKQNIETPFYLTINLLHINTQVALMLKIKFRSTRARGRTYFANYTAC